MDLHSAFLEIAQGEGSGLLFDADLAEQQRAAVSGGAVLGINWHALPDLWFKTFDLPREELAARFPSLPLDDAGVEINGTTSGRFYIGTRPRSDAPGSLRGVGMDWLVKHIIKPATEASRGLFLELFYGFTLQKPHHLDTAPACFPLVAAATDFHSYTWIESPRDTFRCLMEGLTSDQKQERYFWWDIFCQNQWGSEAGDVAATFRHAMAQVQRMVLTVPNLNSPKARQFHACFKYTDACI